MKKHRSGTHSLIQLHGTETFLFLKRSDYKEKYAFHRDLPGGSVDPGEQAKESIIREYDEECGIQVSSMELQSLDCLGTRVKRTQGLFEGIIIFWHILFEKPTITLSHEHTEYKRCTLEEAVTLEPRRSIVDEAIRLFQEK